MTTELVSTAIAQNADTDAFLEHFGIKGMKWGIRHAPTSSSGSGLRAGRRMPNPELDAARARSRAQSAERGKDALTDANAFNNPRLAIGMKAVGALIAAGTVAVSIAELRSGGKKASVVKLGIAAVGAYMGAKEVAGTIVNIRDIHNYSKSKQTAGR
jgi:hypothetical protein